VAATLASLSVMTMTRLLPSFRHSSRALAHQVEVQDDVGATLHIEPSDTPRAGEDVLAWFALTRKGGQTIPLADCDCTLVVSSQFERSQAAPTLEPVLIAVEAEGYEGIPGATLTFPTVGAYTLIISGTPKQANDFTPFELSFDVTVAAGEAAAAAAAAAVPRIPADEGAALPAPGESAPTDNAVPPTPKAQSPTVSQGIVIGVGSVVLLGIAGTVLLRSRQKS